VKERGKERRKESVRAREQASGRGKEREKATVHESDGAGRYMQGFRICICESGESDGA